MKNSEILVKNKDTRHTVRIEKQRRGEGEEMQMMIFYNVKMMIDDDDKECSPYDHDNQFMSGDQVQEHQSSIESIRPFIKNLLI